MEWVCAKDYKPMHNEDVLVIVNGVIGLATYDKNFGFSANSEAFEITVGDDSGLYVSLISEPSFWMRLPNKPISTLTNGA
jgi:hypothetical protein